MIKGFKMKLYPGQEAEYERRHNLLWPEMKDMIHEHGAGVLSGFFPDASPFLSVTVTLHRSVFFLIFAVITVLPALFAFTFPFLETVATFFLLDFQTIFCPFFTFFTFRVFDFPFFRESFVRLNFIFFAASV